MAVEKTALRVTELDFLSIKENLKNYLRSQPEFTDYDFEGSGMSVLLDILAYNTHYMGYYLNMVGNEMFLDTAQLRNSIISHAKLMNYVPASKQGALSKVNIKVTPSQGEDQNTSSLTLEKYTKLLAADINGVNYPFVTLYSNTALKNDVTKSFDFTNINIKQGEVVTLQYLMEPGNTQRRFEIPSANVDTNSIIINVQESNSNTDTKEYILAQDITTLTGNSNVYFIEENENLNYTVYFGDGYIGRKPKNGNIVIITYLDNVGTVSNNISRFIFTESVGGKYSSNIKVTSTVSSYGGIEKETVEEVRFRAPYFYSTQNRAVTKNDYETLLLKDYNYLDSVSIWGGEENEPVVYGKVFLSLKTKGNYFLTNLEKEKIKEDLIKNRNILTVTPEIIDPDYTYIMVKGKVYYDPQLTSKTAGDIEDLVKDAIQDYDDAELNKFNSIFRKSKLVSYIENADNSITGSDIKVYVQKRILVNIDESKNYSFSYNMRVRSTDLDKFVSYPAIRILDNFNIERNGFFEESPDVSTGIDIINVTAGGINYSTPPDVVITGDGSGARAYAKTLSGRVTNIIITNPGKNYTYATVALVGGSGTGAAADDVRLQVETSKIRSYYFDEVTGEKVIINENVGTIYHPTGYLILNPIRILNVIDNPYYLENNVTFMTPTEEANIFPKQNRILTIDNADPRAISIEVIAE